MTFKFVKDDDNNLITVVYERDTSYQDRVDLLDMLVKILENDPKINVLIDTANAESNMSDDEQLEYGDLLAQKAHYFQNNRTAIVKRNVNPHPYILAEAYADGLRNFVEFDNSTDALAWIRGEIK